MEAVISNEPSIEIEDWQMDIEEFDANGCLINGD